MENHSKSIEFCTKIPQNDNEDLSQECTAYLKTKLFMSKRIQEQQEEINFFKNKFLFYSTSNIQKDEIISNLISQIQLIKSFKLSSSPEKENKKIDNEIFNDEFVTSFIIDNNFEKNADFIDTPEKEEKKLKQEKDNLKNELILAKVELNKLKSEKFLLMSELNELIMSLKKVDLNKLNTFYKSNIEISLFKYEMPIANGIKYNILSAQNQINKILLSEYSSTSTSNKPGKEINELIDITKKYEDYISILKKNEQEYDQLLEKKMTNDKKYNFTN